MFNTIIVYQMHHQRQILDACVCVRRCFLFFNAICKIHKHTQCYLSIYDWCVCIVHCVHRPYSSSLMPHCLLIYGTLISHFFPSLSNFFSVLKRTCRYCRHRHDSACSRVCIFGNAALNSMLTCVIIHCAHCVNCLFQFQLKSELYRSFYLSTFNAWNYFGDLETREKKLSDALAFNWVEETWQNSGQTDVFTPHSFLSRNDRDYNSKSIETIQLLFFVAFLNFIKLKTKKKGLPDSI